MIVLRFAPEKMPADWRVIACGGQGNELLSATGWQANGRQAVAEVSWEPERPPERLMVQWSGLEAFLPLNVEDCRELPPPVQLEQMSADDLLWMWSTTDPGAAFRAWAKRQQPSDSFDSDLDSATPIDLDPLRRYDLATTFLHRVRRRARVLAQLRANLPAAGLGTPGAGMEVAWISWRRGAGQPHGQGSGRTQQIRGRGAAHARRLSNGSA